MAMGINASSRGRGRSKRRAAIAEINVTPLVDVMLVLLIIFMVAAPMLQRGVELKLPQSRQTEEISSERIFVDVPKSFRQDGRVFLGKESIGIKVLAERLRQQMVNRNDKQVFLRGDAELQVQNLIDVLDQLKQAGVANVGIVTELPER
jgi:biopolymer transport protein ExbD